MIPERTASKEEFEGPAMVNEENDEAFYKVEKILNSKVVDGKKMYLVKWVGWPNKYATWQPHENIGHLQCFTKNFLKRRSRSKSKQRIASQYDELNKLTTGLSGSANERTKQIGHFLYGDVPKRIVQIITAPDDKNKKPIVEVEWEQRRSASTTKKPRNSFFTINEVMQFAPSFLFEQLQGMVVLEKA